MLIGHIVRPRERRLRFLGWADPMILSVYLLNTRHLYLRGA
jgi:hypothetical protein